MSDKKPPVSLLIGIGKAKPGADAESESGGDAADFEAMASEMLDAIEAKDASGLAESMRAFCDACMVEPSESEAE